MHGNFHLAFATTDLKRIKAFYGKFLGCAEGRSAETWVDYDFFGHQLTIQEVPVTYRTARVYNPKSTIPSNHWGIVLGMDDWTTLRDKFVKLGFQLPDMLGDGALRDAQFIGGGAEAQSPPGSIEGAQAVKRGEPCHQAIVFLLPENIKSQSNTADECGNLDPIIEGDARWQ